MTDNPEPVDRHTDELLAALLGMLIGAALSLPMVALLLRIVHV